MDIHTKEQRSYNMSRVKSKNTQPEKGLFQMLRKAGIRFRKHLDLPGKPDAVLVSDKIVVFVDGEFWHGKNFNIWKDKLPSFWYKKISENIRRDRKNKRLLIKKGWRIIHFWGREIKKNPDKVLLKIYKIIGKTNF